MVRKVAAEQTAVNDAYLADKGTLPANENLYCRAVKMDFKHISVDLGEAGAVMMSARPTTEPTTEPTEEPTEVPTAEPTAEPTKEPTPEPTAEPTAEPTEEPVVMIFLATAYSSAPEENGGFGAVDCKYGQPLPENAIASQLDILPYGTRVYIEGVGERVVVDTASSKTIAKMSARAAEKGAVGWLDIYVGDEVEKAHAWGVRLVKLTVLEWGTGK